MYFSALVYSPDVRFLITYFPDVNFLIANFSLCILAGHKFSSSCIFSSCMFLHYSRRAFPRQVFHRRFSHCVSIYFFTFAVFALVLRFFFSFFFFFLFFLFLDFSIAFSPIFSTRIFRWIFISPHRYANLSPFVRPFVTPFLARETTSPPQHPRDPRAVRREKDEEQGERQRTRDAQMKFNKISSSLVALWSNRSSTLYTFAERVAGSVGGHHGDAASRAPWRHCSIDLRTPL